MLLFPQILQNIDPESALAEIDAAEVYREFTRHRVFYQTSNERIEPDISGPAEFSQAGFVATKILVAMQIGHHCLNFFLNSLLQFIPLCFEL